MEIPAGAFIVINIFKILTNINIASIFSQYIPYGFNKTALLPSKSMQYNFIHAADQRVKKYWKSGKTMLFYFMMFPRHETSRWWEIRSQVGDSINVIKSHPKPFRQRNFIPRDFRTIEMAQMLDMKATSHRSKQHHKSGEGTQSDGALNSKHDEFTKITAKQT